jgi:hypothetical protein
LLSHPTRKGSISLGQEKEHGDEPWSHWAPDPHFCREDSGTRPWGFWARAASAFKELGTHMPFLGIVLPTMLPRLRGKKKQLNLLGEQPGSWWK